MRDEKDLVIDTGHHPRALSPKELGKSCRTLPDSTSGPGGQKVRASPEIAAAQAERRSGHRGARRGGPARSTGPGSSARSSSTRGRLPDRGGKQGTDLVID